MLSFLFKPKWQHRDESVRADAVASLRDVELTKALPRLAREDSSEKVRWAALERLNDNKLLLQAALDDPAEGIRTQARKRVFRELLTDTDGSRFLPLLAAIRETETLERVAVEARSLKLRRSALERIDRSGWLADRALAETDADTRAWLAGRLEPGPSLERLLEAARTRDKRVYKIVKEKLEAAQRNAGSPELAEKTGLALCKRLETLLRELPADAAAQLDSIEQAWAALSPHTPEKLRPRFTGGLETLRRALRASSEPRAAAIPVTVETPVPAAPSPAPVDEPDPQLLELIDASTTGSFDETTIDSLKTRWSKRWSEVPHLSSNLALKASFDGQMQRLKELFNTQLQQRQEQHDKFRHLLDQLGQSLDAGDVKLARSSEAEIVALLKTRRDLDHGSDGKRLAGLKIRLAKLGDWQRWSSNQARVDLCTEVEALPALALHPDAVANKIKELQQRWAHLDKIEGLSPEQAKELGLARRFRALCFQALKPAKGFFEKRAEVRQRHTADFETQIAEVEALLAAVPVDAVALIQRKRDLSEGFRELDRTDPAKRAELAKRMKALLEQISATVDARFAEVRAEKEKLIAQLRLKSRHAPREEAIELVKSTQQRFKAVGRGQRASDQALWDELKAVADPFFAAQKAEREQLDEAARALLASQQQTIDDTLALVAEAALHPGAARKSLEALEQRWAEFSPKKVEEPQAGFGGGRAQRDAGPARGERRPRGARGEENPGGPSRAFDQAFQQAVNKVQAALADVGAHKRQARLQTLKDKAAHCSRIENARQQAEAVEPQTERELWSTRPALEAELENRLHQRFELALDETPVSTAQLESNLTEARRIALLLEFLDGRPSPEAFQAERSAFQVKRLAARLGGTEKAVDQERAQALEAYCVLGAVPAGEREELDRRVFG